MPIKQPIDDATSTVSAWSGALSRRANDDGDTLRQSNRTPQTSTIRPWSFKRAQSEDGADSIRSDDQQRTLRSLPPPPSPKDPWNPSMSRMTMLSNFMQKNPDSLKISKSQSGEPHTPTWSVTFTIDGKVYGRASDSTVKAANERAATQTLEKLHKERPRELMKTITYLPRFKAYLESQKLDHHFHWQFNKDGESHLPRWTCTVLYNGTKVCEGSGPTKRASEEEAACKAALKILGS